MTNKSNKIAKMAIMLALSIVCNIYSFSLGTLGRASFVYLTSIISGIVLGPIFGFLISGLGDLLPALIMPQGPWLPLITLSIATMGLISGLCYNYFPWKLVYKIALSCLLIFVICSCILTPLGQMPIIRFFPSAVRLGKSIGISSPFLILSINNMIKQPFWVVINGTIAFLVTRQLTKFLPKPKIEVIMENKLKEETVSVLEIE